MSARICPVCVAISGTYQGCAYDGISVTPLLDKEKIQIAINTDKDELKMIASVPFPAKEQTVERFYQLMTHTIGKTLMVLL